MKMKYLLAASVVSLSATTVAQAQDASQPEVDPNEIIVTGSILQSQQAALEEKRNARNVADVASADSVGRFPDENIAAALTRLPGVAVQRDQGQARYIQVRGAPNRWTSVSINGVPQTGTDETGSGRAYRFDAVPAVLLSQLVVNKSLTPDLTAEAVTSNVDLVTYSAMGDLGLSVSGDVGYGFMDFGNGEQRQVSLRAGYGGDNWGLVLGGSHYKRQQLTDNREYDYSIGTDGQLAAEDFDVRNYILDRETNGLYGKFEAELMPSTTFHVSGIYTEFKDNEQRNQFEFEIQDGEGTRTYDSGDLVNVPVSATFNEAQYYTRNYVFSAGVDYEDEDFGVAFVAGYTRTDQSTELPLTLTGTRDEDAVSLVYQRNGDNFLEITELYETDFDVDGMTGDLINARRGAPLTALDQMTFSIPGTRIYPIFTTTDSEQYTAKADAYYEFDSWQLNFGGLYQRREIDGNIATFRFSRLPTIGNLGFDVNQYVTSEPWDTNFPLGINFNYLDNPQLDADQEAILEANNFDLFDDYNLPEDFFAQNEDVWAGYVSGDFSLGDFEVTAGVRAEYYEVTSTGTADIDGTLTPLSVTQNFFDLFPSVNAKYNVSNDVILRLSGMRGTSRPAYSALRVGSSIDDTEERIFAGNPGLEPEYTWGLDASLEWYLPGNGIVSVAAFRRWVQDVLYSGSQPVGTDVFNSDGIDRSDFILRASFNGGNGTVQGIEFNVERQFENLPGALSGFGVQGNLSFLDGEFDAFDFSDPANVTTQNLNFPGLSDTILNASVFYEKYGLSARVSYQWRSEFLTTVAVGVGDGDTRGSVENLDVTVRYAINDNFTVFADAANLTNEIYTVYAGTPGFPTEVEQIGARYMFGVRFDF